MLKTLSMAAILAASLPAMAAAPAASASMKTVRPCSQSKAGCPRAMAIPRNDDPNIVPTDSKKAVIAPAVKPAEMKKANVAPALKNEKSAPMH